MIHRSNFGYSNYNFGSSAIYNRFQKPAIRNRYELPIRDTKPSINFNEGKSKVRDSLYDRKLEEMTSGEFYFYMLQYEQSMPKMRLYRDDIRYTEEILNVFHFMFKDGYNKLEQRKQTCNLAMAYFTQTMMRCPNLRKNEIGVIAAASLMVASKFDELDYHLPPASYISKIMHDSAYLGHYDSYFNEQDIIMCEKNICNRLNWQFHQYTPYHFLMVLMDQGIDVIPKSKNTFRKSSGDSTCYESNTSFDSSFLTGASKNRFGHQSYRNEQKKKKESKENLALNDSSHPSDKTLDISTEMYGEKGGVRTLNPADVIKLHKTCEYLLGLSMLVLETQEYSASLVAASCVLGARKIMNIQPVWCSSLEKMTKYSYLDLHKCTNLLLDNYNDVRIGRNTKKTSEILGVQPAAYIPKLRDENSFDSEILNDRFKSSVSPKKNRNMNNTPPQGLARAKSTIGNGKCKKKDRKTYSEKYLQASPEGILQSRNRKNIDKADFTIDMQITNLDSDTDSDSSSSEDLGDQKKVSFAGHLSIMHGSKKLIEELQSDEDKDETPNKPQKEYLPGLNKSMSFNQNIPKVTKATNIRDKYRTPAEMKNPAPRDTLPSLKPPLPKGKKGGIKSTEKREMHPKEWKNNRIHNQHKKFEKQVKIPTRKPYQSFTEDEPVEVTSGLPKHLHSTIKSLRQGPSISKKYQNNTVNLNPENLCNFEDADEMPEKLTVKATRQPSFLSDKSGQKMGKKSQKPSRITVTNLSHTSSVSTAKNVRGQQMTNLNHAYHSIRSRYIPNKAALMRDECLKHSYEMLKAPTIIKAFSVNPAAEKTDGEHKSNYQPEKELTPDLPLSSDEEISEDEETAEPKHLAMKRFYSEGVFLDKDRDTVKAGEHIYYQKF